MKFHFWRHDILLRTIFFLILFLTGNFRLILSSSALQLKASFIYFRNLTEKKKNLIHGYHGIDVLENVISILYTSRFYMSSSGDWREMAVTTCVSDTWSYERVGILVHQSLTLLTSRHYWSMAHQSANLWFVVVPFQNSVGINVGLDPSFASFAISLYSLQFSRLWTELIFVIAY